MLADGKASQCERVSARVVVERAKAMFSTANVARLLKGWLALAAVVLTLLLGAGKLCAQQTGNQGWSQNDSSTGQYTPDQPQQSDYGQQPDTQASPDPSQEYPQQSDGPAAAQPLNAAQLEQLVAPIALYPDPLVAQVLAASTYPRQVEDADQWRQSQRYASPDQVEAGADFQNWDPSVKALTAFPQVLAQMDRNLQWTTDLGNAYYNQPQDVLQAVQVMRRRAYDSGTLQSTPQQAVYYEHDNIQLMPVNPQVVYVPTYNPWTVYGEQLSPYPGFSLLGAVGSFLASSPITYGVGIALSAFAQAPWGWLAWGLDWLAQSVLFDHSDYYSHSSTVADWGFRHDGFHAYAGRGAFRGNGYGRTRDGFVRFGSRDNGNRGRGFARSSERYAGNWRGNSGGGFRSFGSGYRRTSGGGYNRTSRQANNNTRSPGNWQRFNRHSSGSSWNRGMGEGYRGSASAYGRSRQAYRGSASGFQRSELGGRYSGSFASRGFGRSAGTAPHSHNFHLFGGGHSPRSVSSRSSGGFQMGGGGHAPKSFHGGGKGFGGGHFHGGGGHSGGHGGGRHHR